MERIRTLGEWALVEKTLEAGACLDEHVHTHGALTLVTRGTLVEVFGGGELHCGAWQVHYKPSSVPHVTKAGPDGLRMLIIAHRDAVPRNLARLRDASPCVLEGGSLAALVLTVARGGESTPLHAQRALVALCDRLFSRRRHAPRWLVEAADHISESGPEVPSLSDLAQRAGVHPVYLARRFRESYGCSVGQMVRRSRVDRAVQRLIESDVPLCELVLDLGYHDQSHFSRAFARETAWTPHRFRRAIRRLG